MGCSCLLPVLARRSALLIETGIFCVVTVGRFEGHRPTILVLSLKARTPHKAPTPALTPKTQTTTARRREAELKIDRRVLYTQVSGTGNAFLNIQARRRENKHCICQNLGQQDNKRTKNISYPHQQNSKRTKIFDYPDQQDGKWTTQLKIPRPTEQETKDRAESTKSRRNKKTAHSYPGHQSRRRTQ